MAIHRVVVVERADQVAASWRARDDRLKLNTGRQFARPPKRRYPSGTPTFPSRDQVVDYLERHARGLDVRLNTDVERIERHVPGWRLRTSAGTWTPSRWSSRRVVVCATGYLQGPESLIDYVGKQSRRMAKQIEIELR